MTGSDRDRRGTRTRSQIRREIEEELEFHVEMRTREWISKGYEPAAAREEALRRLGHLDELRRSCERIDTRAERRFRLRTLIEDAVQDLAQTVRNVWRKPLLPMVIVLTVALAVGAAMAIFSVADHVLFRPLPYPDADRTVTLWEYDTAEGERQRVSPGNWAVWAEASRSFSSIGLAEPSGGDLKGDGPPEALRGWAVTEGWLETLGVSPWIGRGFGPDDFRAGSERVVLISHALWTRRWGADRGVIGKTITLDEMPATIIGVLPRWLEYPDRRDVIEPKILSESDRGDRRSAYMHAVARLKPGVTVEEARSDLRRIAHSMQRDYPDTNARIDIEIAPLREAIVGSIRPALTILLGAVALLLLISCANAAGLMLIRSRDRQTEVAIRASLGASPGRLMRQLMVETFLLVILAGVIGLLLAWFGVGLIRTLGPADLPRIDAIGIDGKILVFGLLVSSGVAFLIAVAPATHTSRSDIPTALGFGGRTTAGRSGRRLRSLLVAAEIAITVILLVGSALLVRSFLELTSNDLGFDPRGRVSMQAFLWDRNPTPEQRRARVQQLLERIEAVHGVESVAAVSSLPFHPHAIDASSPISIEGRPAPADPDQARVSTTIASEHYFSTMGIPVLKGRAFARHDHAGSTQVAVISERLAESHFGQEDPIGKRVTFGVMGPPVTREIVGVVGDVRPEGYDSEPRAEAFIPYAQSNTGHLTLVARTSRDELAMIPVLQAAFWSVDPDQTIYLTATLESLVATSVARRRFDLILLGAFAVISLVLAVTGVYSLIAFAVRQRSREMGIRMALGSTSRNVVTLMLREGATLALAGIGIGTAIALVLTRLLRGMLYQVHPHDPSTYLQLAVLVFVLALTATWIPARRAATVDPARTLTEP